MKKPLLVAGAALAAVALWSSRPAEPPAEVRAGPPVVHEAPVEADPAPAAPVALHYDSDRLYDKAYENDPGIQDIARRINLPARCVIEGLKQYQDDIAISDDCLDALARAQMDAAGPSLAVGEQEFGQYSDDELRSMATSDARAAVALARRTESDAEAKVLYDRAVALSGVGEPLIEWMYDRETGGLFKVDGVLDVEAAMQGYKTHLVVSAIDSWRDPILESYQRELMLAGVDLGDVEREAAAEAERLLDARDRLVGGVQR